MATLVACLSTGKGTWGHVGRLISDGNFDKVVLITNEFGKENFNKDDKTEFVVVDSRKPMLELVEDIKKELKDKVESSETEVALNLISGTGKEHMAILSAVIKAGLSFRLFSLTTEGVSEI